MELVLIIILILLGGLSIFLAIRLSSLNSEGKNAKSELSSAKKKIEKLSNDLEQSNAEKERQSEELEQTKQLNSDLSDNLAEVRADNQRLSEEVAEVRADNQRLSEEVAQTKERNKELVENNENALWILYLSHVALQMCFTVLQDEQRKLNYLREGYNDFVDDVKSKKNSRLIRRSAFMLINLIPGVSLLTDLGDILSELGDLGDLGEAAVEINGSELEDLEIDNDDPMMLNVSPGGARNILGISTEQNVIGDLEKQDPDILDALIKNAIKRLMEITESLTPNQRQRRLTHFEVNFFGVFGLKLHRSEETVDAPQAGNSPDSRKKG